MTEASGAHSGAYNGMPAYLLREAEWIKSSYSNGQGNCAEFAQLPSGEVALRNSRFPEGPALVYTPEEIRALLQAAKDGEFDHLLGQP
ncbi:protein of unknown function [Streptomyces aidingensis]|uniref:DUF397 domain-containing protein n=2 Tax=Streptomyces aidingensis TaxID=910347 RepID=A0A1I1R1S8_9ACTN|nr:protein of unknown function [Streptomyces aidingensis]